MEIRISVEDEEDVGVEIAAVAGAAAAETKKKKRKEQDACSCSTSREGGSVDHSLKKKRRNRCDGVELELNQRQVLEEERGEGVVVRIDPDALECSICCEPLCPPLYQCQNGHIMCLSCCTKLCNKCHICSLFVGNIRCLALEKVIESIRLPCSNSKFGCSKTLSYTQKDIHQEQCTYAPCSCPVSDCSFQGSKQMLSAHFDKKHIELAKKFKYGSSFSISLESANPFLVLHGEDGHLFLLLNHNDGNKGNAFSITCIRSGASDWDFSYELVANNNGNSLQLKALTQSVRHWNRDYPADVFLLVPRNFCSSSRKILLDACVYKTKGCCI